GVAGGGGRGTEPAPGDLPRIGVELGDDLGRIRAVRGGRAVEHLDGRSMAGAGGDDHVGDAVAVDVAGRHAHPAVEGLFVRQHLELELHRLGVVDAHVRSAKVVGDRDDGDVIETLDALEA